VILGDHPSPAPHCFLPLTLMPLQEVSDPIATWWFAVEAL
jgi:hypothetical protein